MITEAAEMARADKLIATGNPGTWRCSYCWRLAFEKTGTRKMCRACVKIKHLCLECNKPFYPGSKFNRICSDCKAGLVGNFEESCRDGVIYRVQYSARTGRRRVRTGVVR